MKKVLDVFVIREGKNKNYWSRAGVAFVNRDSSLNVKLDLLPAVQFQIRERREKAERRGTRS
jgi:hypothetical protein